MRWKSVKTATFAFPLPVSPQKRDELLRRMQQLGVHENDLQESFVRGSGKGGQKVNKTNNFVNMCL